MTTEKSLKTASTDPDYLSLIAEIDPEYAQVLGKIKAVVFGSDRVLPLKLRTLIHLATTCGWGGLTARGDVQRALEAGASTQEVLEAAEVSVLASAAQAVHFSLEGLERAQGGPVAPEKAAILGELWAKVFGPERALAPKETALIHVGCCCRWGGSAAVEAVRNAAEKGASQTEILEAIGGTILCTGGQGVRFGIDALVKASREWDEPIIPEEIEPTPSAQELKNAVGWLHPFEMVLDRYDHAMFEGLDSLVRVNYERESAIPLKYKHLINVAVGCGRQAPGMPVHIARELSKGTTQREMVEAMELAAVKFATPALTFGARSLWEVLRGKPE